MSEGMYYSQRHELERVFRGALSSVVGLKPNEYFPGVYIEEPDDTPEQAVEMAEDVGSFLNEDVMPGHRKQAVIKVAGLILVHRSIEYAELKELTGFRNYTFNYATGFLMGRLYAEHCTLQPLPRHQLIDVTVKSALGRMCRPTDLLVELAERSEQYPLLNSVLRRYKSSGNS